MKQPAAAFDVHEEEHDEDRLSKGNEDRDDEVEVTKVDIAQTPGESQKEDQPKTVSPIKSRRMSHGFIDVRRDRGVERERPRRCPRNASKARRFPPAYIFRFQTAGARRVSSEST